MKANEKRAAAFRKLDLHDDTLLDLRFIPPVDRRGPSSVRLDLRSTWGEGQHALTFTDCANLSVRLDCDVLKSNWPINTSGVAAEARSAALEKFALSQRHLWDVDYAAEDGRDISPMPKKLKSISRLTLYRVQFFGGRVEVLARKFTLSTEAAPSTAAVKKRRRRRTRGRR